MTDGLKEKLLKLRIVFLDERCTPGERTNAKSLYERLMNKYGLKEDDLQPQEEKEIIWFSYQNKFEERLLGQLVAKIIEPEKSGYYKSRSRRKSKGYELTKNQAEQIEAKYKTLCKALAKELERCYSAFIQINKLGVKPGEEAQQLSPEEEAELEELFKRMRIMRPVSLPQTDKRRLLN